MSDVQLTISKEIVTPIVEAKVKEAILAALGGTDVFIQQVLTGILNQKVSQNGTVSNYSSDNKYSWLDIAVKKKVEDLSQKAIQEAIGESTEQIRACLIKTLKSKKGSEAVATALIAGLTGTFASGWKSKIQVEFHQQKPGY